MSKPKILSSAGGLARTRTNTQWFCLLAGGLLLVRGVSVLVTGPSFGMPGEGWHAMFHLLSGALLLAAYRSPSVAYPAVAAFALAYGLIVAVGVINGHEAFGLIPIDTRDNVLHSAYVAAALAVLATDRARRHALGSRPGPASPSPS